MGGQCGGVVTDLLISLGYSGGRCKFSPLVENLFVVFLVLNCEKRNFCTQDINESFRLVGLCLGRKIKSLLFGLWFFPVHQSR